MSAFAKEKLVLKYWPIVGRAGPMILLLEDNDMDYELQAHDGSSIDPKVFAVPALKVDGEWYSQSVVILQKLADIARLKIPTEHEYTEASCLWTIADITGELYSKRPSMENREAANGYLAGRAEKFFSVIDANFAQFDGPYYYGSAPSACDYQLVVMYLCFKAAFEDLGESSVMKFSHIESSLKAMLNRNGIKKVLDSNWGGKPYFPFKLNPLK